MNAKEKDNMQVGVGTKEFEKPKAGLYVGVLADIVDLGLVQTQRGPKPKIRLIWFLNSKDSKGNYFRVMQQVTPVLSDRATLRGIVRDILGQEPPLDGSFELDSLIGKNVRLVISLEESNGKTYANIKAILPTDAGTAYFPVPQGFVRDQNKPKNGYQSQSQTQQQPTQQKQQSTAAPAAKATAPAASAPEIADEDIPF